MGFSLESDAPVEEAHKASPKSKNDERASDESYDEFLSRRGQTQKLKHKKGNKSADAYK